MGTDTGGAGEIAHFSVYHWIGAGWETYKGTLGKGVVTRVGLHGWAGSGVMESLETMFEADFTWRMTYWGCASWETGG
jgi:hypothetical protein